MIPRSKRAATGNRKSLKNPVGFSRHYSLSEIPRYINVNMLALAKIQSNSNFPLSQSQNPAILLHARFISTTKIQLTLVKML